MCYAWLPVSARKSKSKLDSSAVPAIFLGFPPASVSGVWVYLPHSDQVLHKYSVVWNESRAGGELLIDGSAPLLDDPIETLDEGTEGKAHELDDDGWATVYTTPATQSLRQAASLLGLDCVELRNHNLDMPGCDHATVC